MNKKQVLDNLFGEMEKQGIYYYRKPSELSKGKDVDILVHTYNEDYLLDILKSQGWLRREEPSNLEYHHFFYRVLEDELVLLDVYIEGSARTDYRIYSKKGLGYTVLFVGTDGSGKTTLINHIKNQLPLKTETLYLGENQWAIPLIGRLRKSKNYLISRLWIYVLYPLDLWIRVYKVRRHSKYRLVLIDRIPGFPFIGNKVLRFIYKMVLPEPDFIVLLYGDAKKIWKRKKEIPLDAVEEDMEKWLHVSNQFLCDELIIDTSKTSIKASTEWTIRKILEKDKFKEAFFKEI